MPDEDVRVFKTFKSEWEYESLMHERPTQLFKR